MPRLAEDVVEWMRGHMGSGGWFSGDSHALEVALARLRDEQRAVRAECGKAGASFEAKTYWRIYTGLIEQSQPTPHGGVRRKGDKLREQVRVFANVDIELIRWAEGLCGDEPTPAKPFVNLSQVVEVALRNLAAQAQPRAAGEGAVLDVARLASQYRAL